MSTIAWDGLTLAGDTQITFGNHAAVGIKIFRLKGGALYGAAGYHEDILSVKAWLEAGADPLGKPEVNESFVAMHIVADDRVVRLEEKLVPIPILESYHAIGSGCDYAFAALVLGHGAKVAVEVAGLFDVYTNTKVMTLAFPVTEESP